MIPSAAESTNKAIGTIRFTPTVGKVSRLVVLKEYRKYGFGGELMKAVEEHAKKCSEEELGNILTVQQGGRKLVKLKLHSQVGNGSILHWLRRVDAGDTFL